MKSPIYLSDLAATERISPIRQQAQLLKNALASDVALGATEYDTRVMAIYRSIVQVVDGRELHQHYLRPQVTDGLRGGGVFLLQTGHDLGRVALELAEGSSDLERLLDDGSLQRMRLTEYPTAEAAGSRLTAHDLKYAERLRLVALELDDQERVQHLLLQCTTDESERLLQLADTRRQERERKREARVRQ